MDKTLPQWKKLWASFKIPAAVILLTMPAWFPFLSTSSLPCTHDNAFHYYRITAMRDALHHGWLFSRWIPNLALGYGYPFFNYREPLPYLSGEIMYTVGLPLPLVLGSFYAFSIIMAALGSYVLSRDIFGHRAAWVGAVVYSMAPYVLLDAFRRGNLPESIALALLPWIFIHFRRLIISGNKRDFVMSVLLLAALFLCHNITSLLLVPFLGCFVLYYACLYRENRKWYWAFVAVFAAVLVTAWFWLPAVLEQDMVQLNLSHSTRNNDFHYNFISWRQILFEPPRPYDPQYLNQPMTVTLGIGQGLLALFGILAAFLYPRTREQRGIILLSLTFTLGYLWMCTSDSVFVWEAIPLLSFVQFPWRLVGRALLPVSILGASVFTPACAGLENNDSCHRSARQRQSNLPEWTRRLLRFAHNNSYIQRNEKVFTQILLCIVIAFLVLSAYPGTFPPKGYCSLEAYPDIADVTAYELQGWLGMDPEQSYFPVWVEQHPSEPSLAAAFADGKLPERLDATSLPAGTEVLSAEYRALSASIRVKSPQTFVARWKGLYFPGWQVKIDGNQAQITPEDRTGLITFTVPEGAHLIELRFGSTPLRTLGAFLAFLGVAILAAMFIAKPFSSRIDPVAKNKDDPNLYANALIILGIGLLLIKLVLLDHIVTPIRTSRIRANRLPEVDSRFEQAFDDHITLLGYSVPEAVLVGDGEIQVDLLWQATGNPQKEYRTTILVIGPDGQSWSPAGTLRPSGYETPPPTTTWEEGDYMYDPHIVSLLPGTPPGQYQLEVVIFDKLTLHPLAVLGNNGSLGQSAYSLGTLEVIRPTSPYSLQALGVNEDAEAQVCGSVKLWSVMLDRNEAAPGDIIAIRWVWENLRMGTVASNTAQLMLTNAAGQVAQVWDLPLSADWWSPENWREGERWVGRHVVRLPNQLKGGIYTVAVSFERCDQPLVSLELNVAEIVRVWEIPEHYRKTEVRFGNQVNLVGYDLTQKTYAAGERIELGLSWQAIKEMATSYRVFLHLVDGDGRVVAQDDGEPANWTRPTTGWLPGEVVIDVRELTLPETATGLDYSIHLGLYAEDGTRLNRPTGEDSYVLTTIQVGNE